MITAALLADPIRLHRIQDIVRMASNVNGTPSAFLRARREFQIRSGLRSVVSQNTGRGSHATAPLVTIAEHVYLSLICQRKEYA